MRNTFSIGVLVVLTYYALWYSFRAANLHWDTSWNIPGFILLVGSMPWSLPATNNILELTNIVGRYGRDAIIILSVSLGFAINFTVAIFVFRKLSKALKAKTHHVSINT